MTVIFILLTFHQSPCISLHLQSNKVFIQNYEWNMSPLSYPRCSSLARYSLAWHMSLLCSTVSALFEVHVHSAHALFSSSEMLYILATHKGCCNFFSILNMPHLSLSVTDIFLITFFSSMNLITVIISPYFLESGINFFTSFSICHSSPKFPNNTANNLLFLFQ